MDHWGEQFPETHWSILISDSAATQPGLPEHERFAALCERYWYPLYAYTRRRGYALQDAQDLTQGFFTSLLNGSSIKNADPARGRFRSYLLGALNHYLSDRRKYEQAAKRGGGSVPISIEVDLAEDRFRKELSDDLTPEKLFDRGWALTVIDEAKNVLQKEFEAQGKGDLFAELSVFLSTTPEPGTYAEIAQRRDLKENALRKMVSRLRTRFREALRRQVHATVSTAEEIDDEIGYLLNSFS